MMSSSLQRRLQRSTCESAVQRETISPNSHDSIDDDGATFTDPRARDEDDEQPRPT